MAITAGQTKIDNFEQAPELEGVFLFQKDIVQERKQINEFSRNFMLSVLDLMPEDKPGLVLSSGVDSSGNPCAMDSSEKDLNISLQFDSSKSQERSFQWQLTTAKQSRNIYQIESNPVNLSGHRYDFDSQGRLTDSAEMPEKDNLKIMSFIKNILHNPQSKLNHDSFRLRQTKGEEVLSRFCVESLNKLPRKKYDQEVNRMQSQIDNIGFLAVSSYKSPVKSEIQSRLF